MAKAPLLVVAKVGSSTLVDENGALDRAFIRSLCDQVVELAHEGTHVVLVSSGAAAAGRDELGLAERPSDIMTLQACAAAGQAKLTEAYADVLAERGSVQPQARQSSPRRTLTSLPSAASPAGRSCSRAAMSSTARRTSTRATL